MAFSRVSRLSQKSDQYGKTGILKIVSNMDYNRRKFDKIDEYCSFFLATPGMHLIFFSGNHANLEFIECEVMNTISKSGSRTRILSVEITPFLLHLETFVCLASSSLARLNISQIWAKAIFLSSHRLDFLV